jgi:hypothetical protein
MEKAVNYTPYSNMTDEELVSTWLFQQAPLTTLELELLTRLEKRLNDEAYTELEAVMARRGVLAAVQVEVED